MRQFVKHYNFIRIILFQENRALKFLYDMKNYSIFLEITCKKTLNACKYGTLFKEKSN